MASISREQIQEVLAQASGLGFTFAGASQTLEVTAQEQAIPVGAYSRVLVAAVTAGPGVFARPDAPVVMSLDDEDVVAGGKARIVTVASARLLLLRSAGSANCTVVMFAGA